MVWGYPILRENVRCNPPFRDHSKYESTSFQFDNNIEKYKALIMTKGATETTN